MLWILKDLGLSRKGGARLGGYSLKSVRRYVKRACVQRPVTNPSIDGPIANFMSDLKEKLGFQNKTLVDRIQYERVPIILIVCHCKPI